MEGRQGFFFSAGDSIARGRNAMAQHEVLGEDFAAFEPCGRLGRSEDQAAVGTEEVDHAIHKGRLRTDDGQVGLDTIGKGKQISGLRRWRTDAGGDLFTAWIAGRDDHLPDRRTVVQAPGDSMLTASAAKNEDSHGTVSFACDSLGYL